MSASGLRDERAFLAVEAMLAHLRPKGDAAALMRELRWRFGSADALFRANARTLEEIGLHAGEALLLGLLPELSRLTREVREEKQPVLARLCDASAYVASCFHGLRVERFYLFCLDARGRLKKQVALQEGIADRALFDLRRVLSEATLARADAVILAHNHPALTLRPSQNDLDCTRAAIDALRTVGIPLLDHVIAAGDRVVSIRQYGFVAAGLWLAQNPDHRLLRGWLDGAETLRI